MAWGFNMNQSDSFCTVSLASIANSSSDPSAVTALLNVIFSPGLGGIYTVLTQINYGSGYAGPWEALGTLIIEPGRVTIGGHAAALGYPLVGATIALSGSHSAATTTDSSGAYSFVQPAGGNYTITPSHGGLVFAPLFLSWNNLTANQTADFTALPFDYHEGSGPPTLPTSFTAPDPVLTCDDISGVWKETDNVGNTVGWDLTQTGTSIAGQMEYDAIRPPGVYCGKLHYDVTGSYDGSSLSYSLTATIRGSGNDDCGLPVLAKRFTETITLSGRACGTGSAQYEYSNPSSAGGSLPLMRKGLSSISRAERDNPSSPVAASCPQATPPASAEIGTPRPHDAQGSTTWATISPRFTVQYSSYIPVDHITGPTPCLAAYPFGLKTYKGDAFRGTYRTTESLLIIPGAQKYGPVFARGGPTRNYQIPSSPANGSGANLSSAPIGDPWNGPYTGADEDERRNDCHLWNDKGESPSSEMRGVSVTFGKPVTQVNLYGAGADPLEPSLAGQVGIKWNLTISLDTADAANPKAWVSGGTATCYPAHIVKVNGTKVFEAPPSENNLAYLTRCLIGSGSPVSPSMPVAVPAH